MAKKKSLFLTIIVSLLAGFLFGWIQSLIKARRGNEETLQALQNCVDNLKKIDEAIKDYKEKTDE